MCCIPRNSEECHKYQDAGAKHCRLHFGNPGPSLVPGFFPQQEQALIPFKTGIAPRIIWGIVLFVICPACMHAASMLLVADRKSPFVQNERADGDNLSRMRNTAMLRRFVRHGYLARVPEISRSYYVHDVPAQYRYSRPWTKLFLERLSRQFHAKFGRKLRITSLVRTEARQNRLMRRNPNAAESVGALRSSHLTGSTIDISKRFMSRAERQWMRDVLFSLREKGFIYAIEEFHQPTFHIMVYRSYPQYVKALTRKARRPSVQSLAASRREPSPVGTEMKRKGSLAD